jgi:cytochrome c peroxidase
VPNAGDSARFAGVRQALNGEFNCTSRYSDAKADDCDELRFATTDDPELLHAFKTPSLRNVARRAPYMDAGQLATLNDVVAHYDAAPRSSLGHSELKPLRLSKKEREQLVAFLATLSGPITTTRNHKAWR